MNIFLCVLRFFARLFIFNDSGFQNVCGEAMASRRILVAFASVLLGALAMGEI